MLPRGKVLSAWMQSAPTKWMHLRFAIADNFFFLFGFSSAIFSFFFFRFQLFDFVHCRCCRRCFNHRRTESRKERNKISRLLTITVPNGKRFSTWSVAMHTTHGSHKFNFIEHFEKCLNQNVILYFRSAKLMSIMQQNVVVCYETSLCVVASRCNRLK